MKINHSTELMKNQKHAVTMAPDKEFEVLQTQDGHSLFFSIGTDNVFYCTRETPVTAHGWSRLDFSTALSANFPKDSNGNPAKVAAKTFDVAQDLVTGKIDLALIITVNGSDYLYASFGNTNTDAAWTSAGITWKPLAYDDTTHSFTGLSIADVFIREAGGSDFIIADIIKDPNSAVKTIYRYFVDSTKQATGSGKAWNPHNISEDLEAGKIFTAVGCAGEEDIDGVYTLGNIKNEMTFMYTPVYQEWGSGSPDPIRLNLPSGAAVGTTFMALSVPNPNLDMPYTDIFLAANGSLYFMDSEMQEEDATFGNSIYTHALLNGVQSLHVNNNGSQILVWGLNEQGQVFYMKNKAGSERNSSAWSNPVPILDNVLSIATYVNKKQSNLVIFAHRNDDSMVQLTQDPVTTHWVTRNILLPTTDPMDMVESFTFTTHIQLTDENNVPLQSEAITITPTAICSVYINDNYHVLNPSIPLQINCDATGVLTLVQSVDSLAGVCFNLVDVADPTQKAAVNPMTDILDKLKNVKGSGDLDVDVKDEMGGSKKLVDNSISDTDRDQIAQYIANFVALQGDVPDDGSQVTNNGAAPVAGTPAGNAAAAKPAAAKAGKGKTAAKSRPEVFGLHTVNGKLVFYDSVEKAIKLGVPFHTPQTATPAAGVPAGLTAASLSDDIPPGIKVLAGDGWNWLKKEFAVIESIEVKKFGFINHLLFTIADTAYHIALTCVHDLVAGIHFVLNKIAVAFEDLIKWLGSIFAWVDILKTHAAIKQFFLKYTRYNIGKIDTIKTNINGLADKINANLGVGTLGGDTYSNNAKSNTTDGGQNKPSSNWGTHHSKSNTSNGKLDKETDDPTSIMGALWNMITKEGQILSNAGQELDGVFKDAGKMSPDEMMVEILKILLSTVVSSTQDVLSTVLDICKILFTNIEELLDAPIYIPVISSVYKMFAKADLSILDLICLLVAIPATVIYKLANNAEAPFSDDDVNALTAAADFDAIVALCLDTTANVQATPMLKANALGYAPPLIKTNHLWDKLTFSGNIIACFGAICVSVFQVVRAQTPALGKNKILATCAAASYLPYIMPDIMGEVNAKLGLGDDWYVGVNSDITAVGAFKTLLDLIFACKKVPPAAPSDQPAAGGQDAPAAGADVPADESTPSKFTVPDSGWDFWSPVLEFCINAVWNIPVAFAFKGSGQKLNDKLTLGGNLLFNVSGMISPFCSWTQGPAKWVPIGLSVLCNAGYGALSAAVALDNQKPEEPDGQ